MNDATYFSQRMLTSAENSRESFYVYTDNMGWGKILEEGDPGRQENFPADFGIAPGTLLHYVEDFTSRQRYVYVSSTSEIAASRLATLVESDLHVVTLDNLLEACDNSVGADRGRAIMRLGVAAPHEYSGAVFDRINTGMEDTDPRIRMVSLLAATYSPWPQYLDQISRLANSDPNEEIRRQASHFLDIVYSRGMDNR